VKSGPRRGGFYEPVEQIKVLLAPDNGEHDNFIVQVAVVYVLAVLFNVPRIFQYDVIYTREGNDTVPHKQLTAMGRSSGYDIFYLNIFHTAVLFILPLVVLVIINSIIIQQLQVSKANMRSHSLHYIG